MDTTLIERLALVADRATPEAGYRFWDRRERVEHLRFDTLWDRLLRTAAGLYDAGVRPDDRVAILLPTAPSFPAVYFGCQALGAVPVPLYPPLRLGRLDEYFSRTAGLLRAVDAAAVVSDGRIGRLLGRLDAMAPTRVGRLDAAELLTASPREPLPSSPDDLAMVQFSSGTTVDPKPVALTHRQVLANAVRILDVIVDASSARGDDPPAGCSWLPLYHDMGLIGCLFPAILADRPLTLIPPEVFLAKPAIWLRAISRERATVSPAPDFAYSLCLERVRDEQLEGVGLSSWSLALNGAEPVSPRTLRAFEARFRKHGLSERALVPVYGLSEASLAVTFGDHRSRWRSLLLDPDALARGEAVPADAGVEVVSCGRPLPDMQVSLRDDAFLPVPDRRIGRLWVRGPSVMRGYLDRGDQPFRDGWLDTGDLGFLHEGELYVTGRAKDVIILQGRNHAPSDIERAADPVQGVRTGCAAAVSHTDGDGEKLVLFVEVREAVPGQADAIADAVRASVGLRPGLVVTLPPGTLPRTSSGKIRRRETLARFLAGTLTPPQDVTPLRMAGALADSMFHKLKARLTPRGDP